MIDQRFCKYIKAIAQYHSFSKAAQSLYISQPSLSRFVKRVEDDMGVTLFDRDTIPLGLTPAGQKYLEYIDRFQDLDHKMREDFAAIGKQLHNQLTIATLPLLGIYILPKIVPDFAEQNPSVDQKIVECPSSNLLNLLESGEVDLALTNLKPTQDIFEYQKLLSDPILLAAFYTDELRRKFPGCEGNLDSPIPVDLSSMQEENLIVLNPWQNMRIASDLVCRHYAFTPRRIVEAPSLPSALSLVGCGRGITFICPSYVHSIQPQTPMIYFSLEEVQGVTDILAVFRKDTKNRLVHKFCNCAVRKLGSH